MLERKPEREAGASWTGGALANKHSRMMWLTLVLLLIALGAEVARNSEIWFGGDEAPEAEETAPTGIPNHVAQTPSAPVAPSTPVKEHVVAKTSTKPAVGKSGVVAVSRAVLAPLEVEVVAGENHRNVGSTSNSLKIETLPSSQLNAANPKATEWGPATPAAERVRLSTDQAHAQLQPAASEYSLLGRQMKVQGAVLLQALIGADGVIRELRVLSGPVILASAAREAALQWRFKPYLQNGRPVETQARITVNFSIKVLDNGAREQFTPVVALNGQS